MAGNGIKYRPDQSAANESGTNNSTDTFTLIPNVNIYFGFHTTHTESGHRAPHERRINIARN